MSWGVKDDSKAKTVLLSLNLDENWLVVRKKLFISGISAQTAKITVILENNDEFSVTNLRISL